MGILARAEERLAEAAETASGADLAAVLERAQAQLEQLTEAAAGLEAGLPEQVAAAVRQGVREEAAPVGRGLAEVRGLAYQTLRRLERVQTDLAAERHARVDDLALLVELVSAGWRSVDERLARIERSLGLGDEATVHRLDERRAGA
jgi:hypothetical protein